MTFILTEMEELDPNKILPSDMVIEGVDDILYDIGLSLTSVRENQKKRMFIHNPRLLFAINIFILVNKLACLFIDNSNEFVLKLLGEAGQYYGVKNNFCTLASLATIIMLFSQRVYYNNYKHGIKPSFLKVFRMISGSVTPSSVGLNSESNVKYLMKNLKLQIKLLKFNNNVIAIIIGLVFYTVLQIMKKTLLEIILIVFPHTIMYTIWVHYLWNILSYQILFFVILCRYLRIKLQNLNNNLVETETKIEYSILSRLLPSFDVLYREINEYNVTYWSKFLFIIWLCFGTIIVLQIKFVIYKNINFIIHLFVIYCIIIFTILFLFTILTAASVNSMAHKSYKLFNSLIFRIHNGKRDRNILLQKLKVPLNFLRKNIFTF